MSKAKGPKGKQNALIRTVEIVSFNMASEASYIYFLSGQKLIKNAKNGQFWRSNSVTRQVNLNWTKSIEKMPKFKNSNATFWVIFKHCDLVLKNANFKKIE